VICRFLEFVECSKLPAAQRGGKHRASGSFPGDSLPALEQPKSRIKTSSQLQIAVRSALHNLAMMQYQNLVRPDNCAQPVGNGNRSSTLQ
jgi:hypothetical protein